MALNRARRQHLVLVSLVTLTAIACTGGSLTFSSMQARALQDWVDEGAKFASRIAMRTHEVQRLQAMLAGAQDRLGDKPLVANSMPGLDLRLMVRTRNVYRAPAEPNASPKSSMHALPRDLVEDNLGQQPFIWNDAGSHILEYCETGRAGRIACSALPLDSFVARAADVTALEIRYKMKLGTGATAETATTEWATADARFEAAATLDFNDMQMELSARPTPSMKASYRVIEWRYAAAASLVLYLIAMASLIARRKLILRQFALEDSVARTRAEGEDIVRATLRVTASSADVLVWLLHEDQRLELFGPWHEHSGITGSERTLGDVLSHFIDPETVKTSMLEALRKRTPWSRILVARVDGELITLQSNSCPILAADGQLVGMLGVATDITEGLKAQAEIERGTTAHHAQVNYLRNVTRQMGAAAVRLTSSVATLQLNPHVLGIPELGRLLSMASTEARRVSDVAVNSLVIMSLRSTKMKVDRKPMLAAMVVREAVQQAVAELADQRGQQIEVTDLQDDPNRMVLGHNESLLTMLNIVLSNACRYSPKGSSIYLRLVPGSSHLHIEIKDCGPGVTEEELARLAEPFFRGASSVGTIGSGLGIAMLIELASHTESLVRIARSKHPNYGLLVTISMPWAQ